MAGWRYWKAPRTWWTASPGRRMRRRMQERSTSSLAPPWVKPSRAHPENGRAGPGRVRRRSDVEVQGELERSRAQAHRVELALDLVVDPGLDDVPGEDVSLEEEL